MPGPTVDIGRDLAFFADPQSNLKDAAADYPVAADAVRPLTASVNGKAPFAMFADKRGTSTQQGVIDQKKTGEFSLECYAYTTTTGTAPDWADLLTSGGWQAEGSGNTTVRGTGSTTTQVNVAGTAGMGAGSCIVVGGEIRRITAVDATPGAAHVTVTPALMDAPTIAGAAVSGGIVYKPEDAKDAEPDALTLWAFNNRSADRAIGGVIGSSTLTMGGDEASRITFSGTARRVDRLVTTTLSGGLLNDSAVSFDVTSGSFIPADVSADTPVYFQMDSEVFKIIGVSGNTITVDPRGVYLGGGAAASHTDGSEFYPYQPTGTFAGSPIPATSGGIIIDGSLISGGSVSVEVDQGIIYRENVHGDAYVVDGYVGGMRAVTATIEGWTFYDSSMVVAMTANSRTPVSVHCQQGDVAGSIVAVEMPTFQVESPDLDRGGDEVTMSLTGQARGLSAETEIYILVG